MNKWVMALGLGGLITGDLMFFVSFMIAYFNQSKTVLVMVNEYKEANIEAVLFIFLLVFSCIFVYQFLQEYREGKDETEDNLLHT